FHNHGMVKRVALFVLLAWSAWHFPTMGAVDSLEAPDAPTRTFFREGQTNGPWAAWEDARVVGSRFRRALTYESKLYLRGPSTNAPRLLFTLVSPGGINFRLGPAGLVVFAPGQGTPQIAFPGSEPFMLP